MSKGSKQRPSQVPDRQLEDNWSNIFGSLLNHPLKYSVDVQLDKQSERINQNKSKIK